MNLNRRGFLKSTGVSAAAFNLVPRHVLGGPGHVSPGEKIGVALIGCGTQGLRETAHLLPDPGVRVVAVCDPNRESDDYVDWSRDGLRREIGRAIGKPDWRAGQRIPGGREVGAEMVGLFYAGANGSDPRRGCAAYADFREMLEREKGIDAVKIMTPDHLHAAIAVAAMKAGKRVLLHKPLANRVTEGRRVIETARATRVATHFIPVGSGAAVTVCAQVIRQGAIGTLREIHNWSNRPVWPQYASVPTDTPPVPQGFDWNLWLGPSTDRPYHPHYTHAVFRGWYEFGGGALADMGHYSLWHVFSEFGLDAPVLVESAPGHACEIRDGVSVKIRNDFSFPLASSVRFRFAAKPERPELELFWYDGGMRPRTPEAVERENVELPQEGMLFVGDKGVILADFLGKNPRVFATGWDGQMPLAKPVNTDWVRAFRDGPPTDGDFLRAGPISEAFNLAAVSLRMGGKRLLWDAAAMRVTNQPDAGRYLTRDYRAGWAL
ncbi:MAG: Gfo/Idh/MocA family oxidoreductase [Kiritimatiellia bacterium]|jgi:hypothetical protein|nr:Gfo/Idh/MocA family oxidoreductase [Kiritimatiellia bacterium]